MTNGRAGSGTATTAWRDPSKPATASSPRSSGGRDSRLTGGSSLCLLTRLGPQPQAPPEAWGPLVPLAPRPAVGGGGAGPSGLLLAGAAGRLGRGVGLVVGLVGLAGAG